MTRHIDHAFVARSFSDLDTVNFYISSAAMGLWPSEQVVFRRYLRPKQRILDIGCGAGRTTVDLYRQGFTRIVGMDISRSMIRAARKLARGLRVPLAYEVGNICSTKYADGSFDGAIFSCNGLMHIPSNENRQAAVNEVRRLLAVGGYFIFTTMRRDMRKTFWRRQLYVWNNRSQHGRLHEFGDVIIHGSELKNGYLHFPTLREVTQLIHQSGLCLTGCTTGAELSRKAKRGDLGGDACVFWIARKLPQPPRAGNGHSQQRRGS